MKVLHIAGAFAQHALYRQLVQHISERGVSQFVFAPVRTRTEADRQPKDSDATQYRYRHILKPFHRVCFGAKIRRIGAALEEDVDTAGFDIVHAHSGYSDGAVALRLYREHARPYVVAIRNTDVNYFMRYRPDLRGQFREILGSASCVVFLSPAYRDRFLEKLDAGNRDRVEAKSAVIANGIGDTWLESPNRPAADSTSVRALYVGDFSRNKNVPSVMSAVEKLRRSSAIGLTLVGGGGNDEARVRSMLADEKYAFVEYRGRIDDAAVLRDVYREHDLFVMPSYKETFGVVYIEALSQGLPIVHSAGQGVDGYFQPGSVAEAVDPRDLASIVRGIEALSRRLDSVRAACMAEAARFDWRRIAAEYAALYDAATCLPDR
ncbi:MAG: glycosyltransferase [Woeseiaceae bacterium]|nr:glycosyltransferase [Woeseiaceae bacterium]